MIDASRIDMIFLDDGGVMNDNALRGPEWRRLIGEYMAPRFGGTPEAWGEANRVVFEQQWERYLAWQDARSDAESFAGNFLETAEERERWLGGMCAHAGVRVPARDQCVTIAAELEAYVLPRVRSAYPGAAEAVRALARRFPLATASGGTSRELEGYLATLDVIDCFAGRLYGPDLAQAYKSGPRFYERIFAREGIAPERALVLDDTPHVAGWALEAGANVVLVGAQAEGVTSIARLADLPALLGS
jgi:beta-phosphoglucomutase-like phosphatase (HAD superfamily)